MPSSLTAPVMHPCSISVAQETMLFWDKLVPNSAVYNVPIALHLKGPLNREAIRKTVNLIISRHDVLRSRFLFQHGEPVATISPHSAAELSFIDLSALPATERATAVQDAANAEARRPFQLATDLLLRATLLHLSDTEHVLVLNMHHIAGDGWSVGVLLNELSQAYLAFTGETAQSLPSLSLHYADFAHWQRELLHTSVAERCLAFWKDELGSVTTDLEMLPLDHARPAQQTFRGATHRTQLPSSSLSDFARIGQLRRASAFMVLLTGLQALLHRYSDSDEVLIGVPVANRARPEFEPLMGCFINSVVVRSDISGNPTFLDLLSRVRESALAAFLHPEVPFSEVVRHLRPKRSMNRTPWFQIQLVYQSYPMPDIQWPGLTVRRFEVDTATSKFDLSVLIEMKDNLEIAFEYNTDLFDRSTMQRMLEEYAMLLRGVVKHPDYRLRDFAARAMAC